MGMYRILRHHSMLTTLKEEEEGEKPKIKNNKEGDIFRFFLEYQQLKNNNDVEMDAP
jgi:hypothetical protein